jgi:hypothetical protein
MVALEAGWAPLAASTRRHADTETIAAVNSQSRERTQDSLAADSLSFRLPRSRSAACLTMREACASRAAVSKVARAPYSSASISAQALTCSAWRCNQAASEIRLMSSDHYGIPNFCTRYNVDCAIEFLRRLFTVGAEVEVGRGPLASESRASVRIHASGRAQQFQRSRMRTRPPCQALQR